MSEILSRGHHAPGQSVKKVAERHKLIRPYTPRHNGKVERSHRED